MVFGKSMEEEMAKGAIEKPVEQEFTPDELKAIKKLFKEGALDALLRGMGYKGPEGPGM